MSGNGISRSADLELHTPVVAQSQLTPYLEYVDDAVTYNNKPMVVESIWPVFVNDEHWLTVLCSPPHLEYFVIGFLFNEGLITGPDDILSLQIGKSPEEVIRVQLKGRDSKLPQHRTLTSGCGGGITFIDLSAAREPLVSSFQTTPREILTLMGQLLATVAGDRHRIGGFHTTGLSDGAQFLVITTDIGRHNTLDKVAGECLVRRISMQNTILLTTGRVSTEMLGKAARMQVPVVVTINSPTHLAVELARTWGITLIGYARGPRLHIYTGWERIRVKASLAPGKML